jgi:hypothetical protein
MFRDTEAFAMPVAPAATPSPINDVDATLAYLPVWLEAHERRMIATASSWLQLGETCPEFCGEMADLAARSIYHRPAIVWG